VDEVVIWGIISNHLPSLLIEVKDLLKAGWWIDFIPAYRPWILKVMVTTAMAMGRGVRAVFFALDSTAAEWSTA
jgi:hypothetical protein